MEYSKGSIKREFIAKSVYIKKLEKSQINILEMNFKVLSNQEQVKPQISRWKETINMKAKVNKVEIKRAAKASMKQRICF